MGTRGDSDLPPEAIPWICVMVAPPSVRTQTRALCVWPQKNASTGLSRSNGTTESVNFGL